MADIQKALTPVHFFSHGSTRMLEADTESAAYWKKCGDEALAHGVKGIVIMVSENASEEMKTRSLIFNRVLIGTA